jgi:hypothetical protein
MTTTVTIGMENSKHMAMKSSHTAIRVSPFRVMLRLLTVTLFCQIWFELAGVTVRLEDVIAMILIGSLLLLALLKGI